jgi:hypothetical protein
MRNSFFVFQIKNIREGSFLIERVVLKLEPNDNEIVVGSQQIILKNVCASLHHQEKMKFIGVTDADYQWLHKTCMQ